MWWSGYVEPDGSIAHLRVRSEDSTERDVQITRGQVIAPSAVVETAVVEVPRDGQTARIGVIYLPEFFGSEERTASGEVKKAIQSLQSKKIDGIVLDLRDNKGGLLTEAVAVSGLFRAMGPVTVVGSREGEDPIDDDDNVSYYDGPLAVLVNRGSASASEITAAALQDWGRAVVLSPDPHTFGKGSVQTLEEIDTPGGVAIARITTEGFFRITGPSTTKDGVTPDIQLRDIEYSVFGESALSNVLELSPIEPRHFETMNRVPNLEEYKKHFRKLPARDEVPVSPVGPSGEPKSPQERAKDDKELQSAAKILADIIDMESSSQ